MKAENIEPIILAAGRGSRLGHLTDDVPKCLLEVGGQTIIGRTINNLNSNGIFSFTIVTGYKSEYLKKTISTMFPECDVKYIFNPDFMNTNNIYSLFLASKCVSETDILIIESDICFEAGLISDLMNESGNIIVVDQYQSWMDGTVVSIDSNKFVKKIVLKKEQNKFKPSGLFKTVNIYKLNNDFCTKSLFPVLNEYVVSGRKDCYYEEAFKTILEANDSTRLKAMTANSRWYEVDNVKDLQSAQLLFSDACQLSPSIY